MNRNFLSKLKELLEEGYTFRGVLLSGIRTDTPALLITMKGDKNLTLPICPIGEISEVKNFIKHNYPDVPFTER